MSYALVSPGQEGIASWWSKPLESSFPFVLLTADYRRRHGQPVVGPASPSGRPCSFIVRALVFGSHAVAGVRCWLGDEGTQPGPNRNAKPPQHSSATRS